MRKFDTGATRDNDEEKLDLEGFLSPQVVERFGQYMHQHRKQADGQLRASDNWQKGIPRDAYMKSMHRHMLEVWKAHRNLPAEDLEESLCAMMFNVQGMLFEVLNDPIRAIQSRGDGSSPRHLLFGPVNVQGPKRDKSISAPILDRETRLDGEASSRWEDEAPEHPENKNPNHSDSSHCDWGI